MGAEPACLRIDNELDLPVLYAIHNIWPAFVHLQNRFGCDAVCGEELACPACCLDLETQFLESPCHFQNGVFILLVYRDQHRAFPGKRLLGCDLCLVEGQSKGIGQS